MKKRIRSILIVLAMATAFCVFATGFTFGRTPTTGFDGKTHYHADRFDSYNLMHGADLSEWQDDITSVQFSMMKDAGVDFVILRCGYTALKDLSQHEDRCFAHNYAEAKKAGLKVGAYYYSYAINEREAKTDAVATKNIIKGKVFEMPVYIDIESQRQSGAGKDALAKVANTYCATIEAAGYESGVYASLSWLDGKIGPIDSAYDIWCAQWYERCQYDGDYSVWQYTNSGKIPGLGDKKIDCNYYYTKAVPDVKNFHSNPYSYQSNLITWSRSTSSNAKYELYRKDSVDDDWDKIGTFSNKTTSYEDTGLTQGHKYYYKMRAAITTEGRTKYSSFTSVDYAVPRTVEIKNFKVSAKNKNSIKLTWTKSINPKVQYWVYRSKDGKNWGNPIKVLNSSTTSYTDTGLSVNAKYYYKMCANQKVGSKDIKSDYTDVLYGVTRDMTPGALKAGATDVASCYISWTKSSDNSKYQLYRSTDKKNWKRVATFSHKTTNYLDNNLTPSKTYYYKMRLVCTVDGNNYYSPYTNVDYGIPRPEDVQGFKVKTTDVNSALITWQKAKNSNFHYLIYRGTKPTGDWGNAIANLSNSKTSYENTKLKSGKTYYYMMRGYVDYKGKRYFGDYTNIRSCSTKITPVENFSSHAINSRTVKITWNKINTSNVKYEIYRKKAGSSKWVKVTTLKNTKTKYYDKKLLPNTRYYYKMRAIYSYSGKTYKSKFTNTDYGTPSMPAIYGFGAKALNSKVALLTWTKSKDPYVRYAIYRGYSTHGNWGNAKARLANSKHSYKDYKVKRGVKNYYMMRTYCVINGKTYFGPYTKIDYAYPR